MAKAKKNHREANREKLAAKAAPIICPLSGLEIPYSGRGRPPKYHPDFRKQAIAAGQRTRRAAKKVPKLTQVDRDLFDHLSQPGNSA